MIVGHHRLRNISLNTLSTNSAFTYKSRKESGMSIELGSSHITPAGGNIFLDLGFSKEEAERLLAESDRIIDQKLAIKQQLMTEISLWMAENNLKQVEAADILKVTRAKISDVVHKRQEKFTIDTLVNILIRTGKTITITTSAM